MGRWLESHPSLLLLPLSFALEKTLEPVYREPRNQQSRTVSDAGEAKAHHRGQRSTLENRGCKKEAEMSVGTSTPAPHSKLLAAATSALTLF